MKMVVVPAAVVVAALLSIGCVAPSSRPGRTVTTINADPRPPEDSNQLPLPIPAPQSGPGRSEGSAQTAP